MNLLLSDTPYKMLTTAIKRNGTLHGCFILFQTILNKKFSPFNLKAERNQSQEKPKSNNKQLEK